MRKVMILLTILAAASPAMGKEPQNKKQSDPNRVICRTSEVIGSRLQSKKTCLTAMQWDQMERDQRQTVERVQSFKPNQGQ